ncbi:DUF4835 family protein [Mucilaginibacter daejeonensis]|uniref:type IX secretion system protein PorD n=1 Tax=Mucilaginibacter daejeonensis TaxID=398049 RepID=UPI001D179E63|nr:DUF4835 family protein [Mucilaginibacter daejeonensis]UEG53135.1 DUF4835 family protein [Mucilaginibacter daejeonensis]
MKKLCLLLLVCLIGLTAAAQDLNARVEVLSPKIATTNKRIFVTLQNAMRDFLNGRKWSADAIQPQEKIDCNFILTITAWDNSTTFSGELQVQSTRPVYNASYNSPVFSVNDRDFDFTYTEGQTIDFNNQNFQSNLASVMAFYAYMILAFDYDSFSKFGGTPYYANAQTVVINAQSSSYKGWKAFDNNTNRYWLSENTINRTYIPLREFLYIYHRQGLDLMADNAVKARANIAAALPVLTQLDRVRVGATLPTLFFLAKRSELVSLFAQASPQQRTQAMNILSQADPANGNLYKALQQ